MFQNKIKVIIGSVIFFSIISTLTSCNSAFTGNGTGEATLTINLLGGARALTGFNDKVDSKDLTYSIKLTNNQTGESKNAVINSEGTHATVTGLAVGDWDILAEVSIFENYPYGRGEIKAFPVSAGQNNTTVQMQRLPNAVALDIPNGSRHDFGSVVVGDTPDSFEVTVYNYTGNNSLNVTAAFSNSSGFKDVSSISVPQDGSLKLTVEPDTGTVGEFNPTLTVNANGSVIASFELGLTVTPSVYTVTFDLNGGTGTIPEQTVSHGNLVTKPADPTTTAGGATLNRFRGWYTENGTFANAFDFNAPIPTSINSNITLYADWGYRLGDTGEGGGIIFYRVEIPFTVEMVNPTENYTAHYLEAAPNDMTTLLAWAPSGSLANSTTIPEAQSQGIGYGRRSTAAILSAVSTPATDVPAAHACDTYPGPSNTNDWFLPSSDELNELYNNKSLFNNWGTTGNAMYYWSSYQSSGVGGAQYKNFNTGTTGFNKASAFSVRAIRAF